MTDSPKAKKPFLALLQWIGEDYDQALTVGVPIDWILGFDRDTFDPDDDNNLYVVEWRETKKNKKPKRGYDLYDARVLKISRNLKTLNRYAAILDGQMSPLRPERTLETLRNNFKKPTKRNLESELDDSEFRSAETSEIQGKKTKRSKNKHVEEPMDTDVNDRGSSFTDTEVRVKRGDKHSIKRGDGAGGSTGDGNGNKEGDGVNAGVHNGLDYRQSVGHVNGANAHIKNGNGTDAGARARAVSGPAGTGPGGDGHVENLDSLDNDQTENHNERGITNEQIHRDNQLIKRVLNALVDEVRGFREAQAEIVQGQGNNQNRQQDPNDLVENGKAGSNVFVQRRQWETAENQNTFQGMGRSLVRALFPDEVLLRSNHKGGTSKINKNAPKRPALDSGIIKAIKESVMQKFPNDFRQVLFGMAVNNIMTGIRSHNKNAEEVEVRREAE